MKLRRNLRPILKQPNKKERLLACLVFIALGIGIGVFQKWLDSTSINELPGFLEELDISNYFGRLSVWILLGSMIAVYAPTPLDAGLRVFVFLISMIVGYYWYCKVYCGFLPYSYMMIWIVSSIISFGLGMLVWYAKGEGSLGYLLTTIILACLLMKAVNLSQGFYVYDVLDLMNFFIGVLLLARKQKEYLYTCIAMIPLAYLFEVIRQVLPVQFM